MHAPQWPPTQPSPAMHAIPQPPQFAPLVLVSTHAPPQRASVLGQVQVPPTQLAALGQGLSQLPQFAGSVAASTH